MSEPQTNPQSFATLSLRVETKDGPRTAVVRNMSVRDASLVAAALIASGHHAEYHESGEIVSFVEHLAQHAANKKPLRLVRRA